MNLEQQRVGEYVLIEQLRQDDQTGSVYRACRTTGKDPCVIKILPEKYGKDPGLVARFRNEATNLARLTHPGIARVLDHGESAHGLYLVTEALGGESLADRLRRERRLPLPETQRLVEEVASALAAAHRLRLVHGALDADSVYLVPSESGSVVKVIDLGLAKILGGAAAAGGKGVDQRADIHALGRLAYQMLSGQAPPASGAPTNQQIRPARLATLGVTVPSSIEAAIVKAIERKKKRRFSSMAEFARAFGVALAPAAPAEPASLSSAVKPPPVLPVLPQLAVAPRPERFTTLAGVVAPLRDLSRRALGHRQALAVSAGVAAAALAIIWLVVRAGRPPERTAIDVVPPPASHPVGDKRPPLAPPAPLPAGASRVDDILALNQKAVSAYAQADFKTARALLQQADQLAVASGYQDAMVRAQTQLRLGALWIGGERNPRVGRRYLAHAVAINPAVALPAGMTSPQVRKALHAARARALAGKSREQKRALNGKPMRRRGRDLQRPRQAHS